MFTNNLKITRRVYSAFVVKNDRLSPNMRHFYSVSQSAALPSNVNEFGHVMTGISAFLRASIQRGSDELADSLLSQLRELPTVDASEKGKYSDAQLLDAIGSRFHQTAAEQVQLANIIHDRLAKYSASSVSTEDKTIVSEPVVKVDDLVVEPNKS